MTQTEPYGVSTQQSYTIDLPKGSLEAVIHLPRDLPAPTVVCCHGMLSSKDSGKFVAIAEHLSRAGLVAVRFDFSGCGESQTALLDSLLATRMRDLRAVIAHARRQSWMDGRLGLLGSSLGGYLALLAAAEDQGIQSLVCWATPFDLTRIRLAMEAGHVLSPTIPQGLTLGTPQTLAMLTPIPRVLIVHGQADEIVDWQEAGQIYQQLRDPKQLLLFETADHRFVDPICRQLAMVASVSWFQQSFEER
jgi:uncharacterized protein